MGNNVLEQFLVTELFAFLLIFCRIGSGVMLLPGVAEGYVSSTIRLAFAAMLSLVLVPVFSDLMPDVPGSPFALLVLILAEVIVGIFIGFLARMIINTLHLAGTIIAQQSSLSLASIFDATQGGQQSTLIGNFLTLTGLIIFFSLNLHYLVINALADSYSLFPPGMFPMVGDMSEHLMMMMSKSFMIAIQLSAPHLVFALIFYLGSGVLARLMPAMQVFFVLMPAQIMSAFFLLIAVMSSIMIYHAEFFEDSFTAFLVPQE